MNKRDILQHWDEKSKDGVLSGTVDLIGDKLEQSAILREIKCSGKILEIGCGDGRNAINIIKHKKNISIEAFDFSKGMITQCAFVPNRIQ